MIRPRTPDTCLEYNASPCSLSVSDDPSNALDHDQRLEELGLGVAQMTLSNQFSSAARDSPAKGWEIRLEMAIFHS